jgi:rsbT co-antagonist protein RsbR
MQQYMSRWFSLSRLEDPIEREQAGVLQILLWSLVIAGLILSILAGAASLQPNPALAIWFRLALVGLPILLAVAPLVGLLLLHRGRFQPAVIVTALGFTLVHGIGTLLFAGGSTEQLPLFFLPIILVGLLSRRNVLLLVAGLVIILTVLAWLVTPNIPTPASSRVLLEANTSLPRGTLIIIALGPFLFVTVLIVLFFTVFGEKLRIALSQALIREHELRLLRASLEDQVAERTTELREALDQIQNRADQQTRLIEEIEGQRAIIREMSVPVLPLDAVTLVIPLIGGLDSERLHAVHQRSLQAIERTTARRLLLDITGVPVVDSAIAQGLLMVMRSARLLGAEVALIGVRPEVAQAIVGLGLDLQGMQTYRDLQSAQMKRALS